MTTMQAERATTGSSVWPRALTGAGLALLANLAVWAVAAIVGIDVMIPEAPNSDVYVNLSVLPVVLASLVPALVAAAGLLVLRRFIPGRALRVFQVAVGVLTVLSLGAPLGLDVGTGGRVALVAMHLVTGAAIVLALSRGGGSESAAE
jgi:hypothetical protein